MSSVHDLYFQVGHLHPGHTKDMMVTFVTTEPVELKESAVLCKISKITFDKPLSEVADWDDRIRCVKWVDVHAATGRPSTASGER